jgi:predicted metal-dependent hydrolase
VQLSLPLTDATDNHAGTVLFVRHRRARRYILRVLPDGTLRVTLPRWGVKRDAHAFIAASGAWIARQLQRQQAPRPRRAAWGDGTAIWLDGRQATLTIERSAHAARLLCDGTMVTTLAAGDEDVRPCVEAWLRDRARRELPALLLALAERHQIAVTRVSVRDQRSRWGACSPTGTITLNWRLIQTPPFVREYVVLHELMHRREMNHSRRFWRLVAACCPRHAEARQWLKQWVVDIG